MQSIAAGVRRASQIIKGKPVELILVPVVFLSLCVFLRGPTVYNGTLSDVTHVLVLIDPEGNYTANLPVSIDQALYLTSATNLIVDDYALVSINSSSGLDVSRVSHDITSPLASNSTQFRSVIPWPDTYEQILLKSTITCPVDAEVTLHRIITVRMADYTCAFAGLSVAGASLVVLQLMTLFKGNKTALETLLRALFDRVLPAGERKAGIKLMGGALILEVYVPFLLVGVSVYAWVESRAWLLGSLSVHALDYVAKLVLIATSLAYLLSMVVGALNLLIHTVEEKIMKKEGNDILSLYRGIAGSLDRLWRLYLTASFFLLVLMLMLIVSGSDIWTILSLTTLISVSGFAILYYLNMKSAMRKYPRAKLVSFVEADARAIGMWVFGLIGVFVVFAMTMPLFSAATNALLTVDTYPKFLIELGHTFATWVSDTYSILFELQVFGCLIVVLPYWVTRLSLYLISPILIRMVLIDIVIFSIVFFVSEYLTWVAQGLTVLSLMNSLVIGMAASVVRNLIEEHMKPRRVRVPEIESL